MYLTQKLERLQVVSNEQVCSLLCVLNWNKRYSSPVTGLEWPRVSQEVKVPKFHNNGTRWW